MYDINKPATVLVGRPRLTRSFVLVVMLTLIASCSRSGSVSFPDDGFINFEPSIEMFPDPPVAGADVTFGFGAPEPWQWEPRYCPSPTLDYGETDPSYDYPVIALDWTGVRYDWVEESAAKAWIISEQTIGFADDDTRDDYLAELRSAVDECGWEYDDKSGYGYNAIPIELPRLPQGSVAYKSERDPRTDPFVSDEETFQSFTVLIPGDRPNHLIVVSWTGWGTDVAAEPVEPVAAALAAKANAAAATPTEADG